MNLTFTILLIFGAGVTSRGLYAIATKDVTDNGEGGDGRMVGSHAVRYGIALAVIGVAISSYAIFQWSWVTALVVWIHSLG